MSKKKIKETFLQKLTRETLQQEIIDKKDMFRIVIKPENAKWIMEKLQAFLDSSEKSTSLFLRFDDNYTLVALEMKYVPDWRDDPIYKPMEYKALHKMEEWPSPA